ncbi:hypothetical protein K7432_010335 [Basidiobolus ranarum]|uniref:LysM domain-containing protein n=1 Tax=Basidiobolus ranarum TaxID=34480 RepID=A0ABR2VVM9_9FUNG
MPGNRMRPSNHIDEWYLKRRIDSIDKVWKSLSIETFLKYVIPLAAKCFYSFHCYYRHLTWCKSQDSTYCAGLPKACKIDINKFYSYNPGVGGDFSKLVAGQKVCCNVEGIPLTPNPDGSCANYNIKNGDYCNAMAAYFGITNDQLFQYNKQTWG